MVEISPLHNLFSAEMDRAHKFTAGRSVKGFRERFMRIYNGSPIGDVIIVAHYNIHLNGLFTFIIVETE